MSAPALEAELRALLQDLLYAIAMGDVAALEELFCEDGTLLFAFGQPSGLIAGRAAVLERFRRMFTELAARHGAPPYTRFKIEEFTVQPLDARHAAAYATLSVDGRIGRRTVLCRKDGDQRRILHLHASNIGPPRTGDVG